MNDTDSRPAVVGQVEPSVRPEAWMIDNGFGKPWPTRADSEAYKLAATRQDYKCEPLYSKSELDAAVATERKRCAALCRRVADETRNSEDARAAGRMLANWISTGDPNDPGPNAQAQAPA